MDLSKMPLEIQVRVLNRVPETDLEQAYNVSSEWRKMVQRYQNNFANLDKSDWRWYCRHQPSIKNCQTCYNRIKTSRISSVLEWDWWSNQFQD